MLLSEFVGNLVDEMCVSGRYGSAKAFQSTICSVISYSKNPPTLIETFTPTWLISYRNWLTTQGKCWNIVMFYMHALENIYKAGIEEKLLKGDPHLFKNLLVVNNISFRQLFPIEISSYNLY